jgi:hypothetical protein
LISDEEFGVDGVVLQNGHVHPSGIRTIEISNILMGKIKIDSHIPKATRAVFSKSRLNMKTRSANFTSSYNLHQ